MALLRRAAYAACIVELSRALELLDWRERLSAGLVYAQHKLGSDRRARELMRAAKEAVGDAAPREGPAAARQCQVRGEVVPPD